MGHDKSECLSLKSKEKSKFNKGYKDYMSNKSINIIKDKINTKYPLIKANIATYNINVNALLDTGSCKTYVSKHFCEIHQIKIANDCNFTIQLTNNMKVSVNQTEF
ncbi:hypothetical protein H311_01411 [Anncaliia algerae PRA109]|nr:hypothetical protein H311_01411 [Anncaliia algerae PRA109]